MLLVLFAIPASACGILAPDEQRKRDKEDVAVQVRLAEGLAREADAVFIGHVVDVGDSEASAKVEVERVIKGKAEESMRLPANDPDGLTISCYDSDMFRNSQLVAGRQYLFYVRGGSVLRAGWTQRSTSEVSLQGELRAVRRTTGH